MSKTIAMMNQIKTANIKPFHVPTESPQFGGVINKLNLQAHMDKTNLAAFVEAVTGGNIECKPKDTVSYKEPEKTAKEAADEWLKKIGVK